MANEKYWLFDGKDAAGPFYADELKKQAGFGPESLICPDGADTADQWKAARYYLLKPPGARPESAPERKPEPKPEPLPAAELPSVLPQPAPAAAPAPFPVKPVAIGSAILLSLAAATYVAVHRKAEKAPPQAETAAQTPTAAPAAPVEQLNAEAVDFVLKFPVQSPGAKLPAAPDEVLSTKKWRSPATVGEGLEMRSFFSLAQTAGQTLQKQGHTPEMGAAELRRHGERWQDYARRYLKSNYRVDWSTQFLGGDLYRVTAELRYHRDAPKELHSYEVDLKKRTIRPLDADAWQDVDPKGLAAWGDKNIELGAPIDPAKLAAGAPAYPYPLPKRELRKKRPPVDIPVAAAKRQKKTAAPRAAPKPAGPPPPEDDYPDEAAPPPEEAPQQASARTKDPWANDPALDKPSPKPQTAPGPKPAPPETKLPGTDMPTPKSAPKSAPPAGPSPSPKGPPENAPKSKNATDMSVDELENYLKRGADNK